MRRKFLFCCLLIPVALYGQTGPVSGSVMNPNISLIGDFRGMYTSELARKFEFMFNEAEVSFQSSIDPYARADVFFSWGRDSAGEYSSSVEEAYVTTLSLPMDIRLKAGRYRMTTGRLNTVHPHTLPFSDLPAANRGFFGEEGLIDEGVSLSWLIPNPLDFYQEIVVEASDVPAESPFFMRPASGRYLYLAHLKNFIELDENTTVELGLTGLSGPNEDLRTSTIGGIDFTLKWKPLRFNRYRSLTWQSEVFLGHYGEADGGSVRSLGCYSFLTYQLAVQWFMTGRFDYTNLPRSADVVERGYSATLGWYATEFQKIGLSGKLVTGNAVADRSEIALRWIFVIGAHGAHAY
ncbi:MAG TPA: hypothetical protein VJO14_05350 [Bacteroidota bacterium]|nr:hypothetical protein [Bacteroidota bacterium]